MSQSSPRRRLLPFQKSNRAFARSSTPHKGPCKYPGDGLKPFLTIGGSIRRKSRHQILVNLPRWDASSRRYLELFAVVAKPLEKLSEAIEHRCRGVQLACGEVF